MSKLVRNCKKAHRCPCPTTCDNYGAVCDNALTDDIVQTLGWVGAFDRIVEQIRRGELDMPRFELTLDGPGKRYANYEPQTLVIYAENRDDAWHRANVVFEGTNLTVVCVEEVKADTSCFICGGHHPQKCPPIERKQP